MELNYKYIASFLFNNKSNNIIPNSMLEHVIDFYECVFENAEKEILIFCKNISNDIFENSYLIEKINDALNRKINIKGSIVSIYAVISKAKITASCRYPAP